MLSPFCLECRELLKNVSDGQYCPKCERLDPRHEGTRAAIDSLRQRAEAEKVVAVELGRVYVINEGERVGLYVLRGIGNRPHSQDEVVALLGQRVCRFLRIESVDELIEALSGAKQAQLF